MRVSERLQSGFWTWSVVVTTTIIGLPFQVHGQLIRPVQNTQQTANADAGGGDFLVPATNASHQAKLSLLKARQALAHGDVTTAQTMVDAARQYAVDFGKLNDSPDTIQNLIEYQNELAGLAAQRDRSFNQKAADFLLNQANVLIDYEDFETAELLINQAERFPVDFSNGEQTPQALTERLVAARTAATERDAVVAEARRWMSVAQLAFDQGNYDKASAAVAKARELNVDDSAFGDGNQRPWQLELKIQSAREMGQVVPASFNQNGNEVVQADYDPQSDETRNVQVQALEDSTESLDPTDDGSTSPRVASNTTTPAASRGMQLYQSGVQALRNQDRDGARDYFQLAWQYREQLDPGVQQSIQDNLANLGQADSEQAAQESMDLNANADGEQVLFRKLQSEVFKQRAAAERLLPSSPRQALDTMMQVRERVARSELNDDIKRPLLTIVDRDLSEMQSYVEQNLPDIMNSEANAQRMENIEARRERRYDIEQQVQSLVEDFNRLLDEGRYAEAEAIARQANELDSDSEVVTLLREKARVAIRVAEMERIKDEKEAGFYQAMRNVESSSTPFDDTRPLQWGDRDEWASRVNMRAEAMEMRQFNSVAEREIWNKLKNIKVQGQYRGTLFDVVDQLSTQSGVNIIFDNIALAAEGIETNRPVDIPIHNPISLRSALNVVLGSAGLVYVVEDEVIKVTSRDAQRRDVKPKTYYVGDLVMPIQNMNSALNMNFLTPGMSPATNNFVAAGGGSQMPLSVPARQVAQSPVSPVALAQQTQMAQAAMGQQVPNAPFGGGVGFGGNNYGGGPVQTGQPQFNSLGPPQLGGVTEADFEPLIDLIKSTIDPEGWDDTNGDGTIQAFVPNLSLIVSQTQEVQDQIQDLLTKLRELNDVQIVIEVRFVTLRDNFFERIGIDFDFNINDYSGLSATTVPEEVTQSTVIGRGPVSGSFSPTSDLDVQFLQDSFASAIPQFGGFDAATAANFGFAILSDIEVFFLIQASKGDTRSNIMQAPTITMFNGQSATVSDGALRPFVTSVIPVVGDFAVAQQPVITLLPDGTSLNVQAVVSNDRKSVRMTLVPFFSQIQEVSTFTFDGSTTTRRESDSLLDDLLDGVDGNIDDGVGNNEDNTLETTVEGVTIQLPTIGFTTVNTVVNVPDGGTVLLGGVKRMSEGRTERGVPFLSNVPYINRLFKNVGIGRETSNIMMMVTPRIIIVAEEEQAQVGSLGGN